MRYRAISLKLFHRPFFDYYRFVWQISSICYQFHACVSYNSISFNSGKAYIQKNIHYWFHQSPKQYVQTKAYTPHRLKVTVYLPSLYGYSLTKATKLITQPNSRTHYLNTHNKPLTFSMPPISHNFLTKPNNKHSYNNPLKSLSSNPFLIIIDVGLIVFIKVCSYNFYNSRSIDFSIASAQNNNHLWFSISQSNMFRPATKAMHTKAMQ